MSEKRIHHLKFSIFQRSYFKDLHYFENYNIMQHEKYRLDINVDLAVRYYQYYSYYKNIITSGYYHYSGFITVSKFDDEHGPDLDKSFALRTLGT